MNQRFAADCYKIFAHMLKDDQKQNQLALCKGLKKKGQKGRRLLSRGLSGYRAHRRVADSRGPVLVAGLSLNK
jgi:hypothetical protein